MTVIIWETVRHSKLFLRRMKNKYGKKFGIEMKTLQKVAPTEQDEVAATKAQDNSQEDNDDEENVSPVETPFEDENIVVANLLREATRKINDAVRIHNQS